MEYKPKELSLFARLRFPIIFGTVFVSMATAFVFRRTLIGDTQTESRLLHKEDPLAREKIAAFIQEQSKLQDEKAKNKKL